MEPEPVDGCEIKCPECFVWSKIEDWEETSVGCELCGEHTAIRCPKCSECFDHVHGPKFETRSLKSS